MGQQSVVQCLRNSRTFPFLRVFLVSSQQRARRDCALEPAVAVEAAAVAARQRKKPPAAAGAGHARAR